MRLSRFIFAVLFCLLAGSQPSTMPAVDVFPEQTKHVNTTLGSIATDIARHLPDQTRYQERYHKYLKYDVVTAGHEWTHFINEYLSSFGKSGYYLLDNRFAILDDPKGLHGIVPHVPASLRGDLYQLYLVGNSSNASIDPLYLLDEWVAYINDVYVAVNQLEEGKKLNPSNPDAIQPSTAGNVLEFTFYAFATAMSVEQHDPKYFAGKEGKRLMEFVRFNTQRAMFIYRSALRWKQLNDSDSRNIDLPRNFRSATDCKSMRNWAVLHKLEPLIP